MNNMPKKLREQLADDPYMKTCARRNEDCFGRITWEHALIVGGKQLQRAWCIVPLCVFHHLDKGLEKNRNRLLALNRATDADLDEFPKANLRQMRDGLRKIYDYGE